MKVGFVGLGLMGSAMARRLAGHELFLWDRTASKAVGLSSEIPGSRAVAELSALDAVDAVIVMVRDSAASWSVIRGLPKGGKVIVNTSTIMPSDAISLASFTSDAGGTYLDAPVVGSTPAASEGKLLILASGDRSAVERLKPLLSSFGMVHYMGAVGAGSYMKLTSNLMLAGMMESLAEALGFAMAVGLDMAKVKEALKLSPYRNPLVDMKFDRMLAGDFSPQFPLDLMHKDLKYIVREAQDRGAFVPATSLVEQLFSAAELAGYGREDLSAILKLVMGRKSSV